MSLRRSGFSGPSVFAMSMRLLLAASSTAVFAAEVGLATKGASGTAVAHASTVKSGAFRNATGVVRANLSAGDGNVQQNSTALAASQGVGRARVKAKQISDTATTDFYRALSARIERGAFDGVTGINMVNQSAGTGNVQFNGAAIAVGGLGSAAFVQLNNESLRAQSGDSGGKENGRQALAVSAEASIDPNAFENARGVIMINQAAGNNNATSNSFTLTVGQ